MYKQMDEAIYIDSLKRLVENLNLQRKTLKM